MQQGNKIQGQYIEVHQFPTCNNKQVELEIKIQYHLKFLETKQCISKYHKLQESRSSKVKRYFELNENENLLNLWDAVKQCLNRNL